MGSLKIKLLYNKVGNTHTSAMHIHTQTLPQTTKRIAACLHIQAWQKQKKRKTRKHFFTDATRSGLPSWKEPAPSCKRRLKANLIYILFYHRNEWLRRGMKREDRERWWCFAFLHHLELEKGMVRVKGQRFFLYQAAPSS